MTVPRSSWQGVGHAAISREGPGRDPAAHRLHPGAAAPLHLRDHPPGLRRDARSRTRNDALDGKGLARPKIADRRGAGTIHLTRWTPPPSRGTCAG